MQTTKEFWVYILFCENNSYYTGYTTNLKKRYQAHINGKANCKYTRSFKPLRIAQHWKINGDKALAMKIERFIKSCSKSLKENLILYPDKLADYINIDATQ
jgi:putative endonuclease